MSFEYDVIERLRDFGILEANLTDAEQARIAKEYEHAVDATARLICELRE